VIERLQTLRHEYQRERLDRQVAQLGKKRQHGACRYCGGRWYRVEGSALDGHAKCIVGPGFKALIDELLGDARITYRMIANTLGVTVAIVRSWVRTKGLRA
jgi:hypothetical protein